MLEHRSNRYSQWQPIDIVIFGEDKHIGILSDRHNRHGKPYVLHNSGQSQREQNYLPHRTVTDHYRFDASRLAPEKRIPRKSESPFSVGQQAASR